MATSHGRYFLTADRTRVVEEGDPEAAFLVVAAGGDLGAVKREFGDDVHKQVEALNKKAAPKDEAKAKAEPEENKAVEEPAENKAIESPASTKRSGRGE